MLQGDDGWYSKSHLLYNVTKDFIGRTLNALLNDGQIRACHLQNFISSDHSGDVFNVLPGSHPQGERKRVRAFCLQWSDNGALVGRHHQPAVHRILLASVCSRRATLMAWLDGLDDLRVDPTRCKVWSPRRCSSQHLPPGSFDYSKNHWAGGG